ncbi:sensor domain-containing diguanylate cyclase [Pseudoalteromonas carrageenovora]|uniref:sensor domain-containing diguanylate cyclase n=1 Tax=Pseudoalteromonas carrageenovora TaxID=227 RepID=UPI0026E2AADC|nr:sensor domain-containing diguanylate cyclase [Pseudoalteromonas carrageenovora]MDO6465336.1 sensor domain-containing diguanylate cyclase [Pseudoalteromonas carrageenovora]
MIKPETPSNEIARLRALRALKILDTAHEERFDRVTRIAKHLFNVSISLVTLIDEDRQWFKSRQGLGVCELPRESSFCGHTINQNELLIIPDTSSDERFFDNPFVVGDPKIRFYAGFPLKLKQGVIIGTLCLADDKPRNLSDEEKQLLRDLGSLVEQEIQSIQLATIDELTKISNRRGFLSLAEHTLNNCKKNKVSMTLILFDLNKFKQINDVYGHHEGDFVLTKFAQVMLSSFCDCEVIGRLGGDEFVVMLSDSGTKKADDALLCFTNAIEQTNSILNKPYNIDYSFGVVNFTYNTDKTVVEMIQDADTAMYKQKKQCNPY